MKFSFENFLIFIKIKLLLSENGKYPKGISWNRFVHISFLHGLFFFRPCTETRPLTETEWPAVRAQPGAQIRTSLHPANNALDLLVKKFLLG